MKCHVITATITTSALEAARIMRDESIGFLPICDGDGHPLGVVTDRDLAVRVCAENLNAERAFLSTIMSQDPLCCRADDGLEHAEAAMLKRRSRRILVLDGDGKLAGLITLADIAHHRDPFNIAHFVRSLTESRLRVER